MRKERLAHLRVWLAIVRLLSRRHLHGFHRDRLDVEVVVAPEQAQRPGLQDVHLVRPIQLDLAHVVAQVVRVRDDNLVLRPVLQAGRALGQVDAAQRSPVRVDGRRHVALHPALGLPRLRQLNREAVVALCGTTNRFRCMLGLIVSEEELTAEREVLPGGEEVLAGHRGGRLIGLLLGWYDLVL